MSKSRLSACLLLVLTMLAGTAGAASADHTDEHEANSSVVDASDNNVQVPVQACHNDVPVNVLGVQVPVQEISASLGLPILSDDSPATGPDTSCDQNNGQENDGGQENRGSGQEKNVSGPGEEEDEGLLDELV